MAETTDIRFDGWILRRGAGELVRGSTCIRLQEQPLQILEYLLTQPGELVSREQLITKLWPTGVVDFDTSLNSAVRKLRIALSDDAETPRYIETIPRRGYRFIGRIEPREGLSDTGVYFAPADAPRIATAERDKPAQSEPPITPIKKSRRLRVNGWSTAALLLLAVIGGTLVYKSYRGPGDEIAATIVVLPFVDMSTEQQDQPFCDGLSEELSNWLAQVPSLRVVSRSSAFSYKGKNIDARQIGKDLSATHVLEGSVRRNGKDVRVTAQLINARDGLHIWSKSFDLTATNVLQVEDNVSRGVTKALELQLSPRASEQLASRQPAKVDAYELYLVARHHQRQLTQADNERAKALFTQALAIDSQFSLGYVGLAKSTALDAYFDPQIATEALAHANELLDQASHLNPMLPEVFALRGYLSSEQLRFGDAVTQLRQAILLNPNDASSYALLGQVFQKLGNLREALSNFHRASDLDPLNSMLHVYRCLTLQNMGNFAESTLACERARQVGPNNFWGPLATGLLARKRGELDQALHWNREALRIAPADSAVVAERGQLQLAMGLIQQAAETYKEFLTDPDIRSVISVADLQFAAGGAERLQGFLASVDTTRYDSVSDRVALASSFYDAGDIPHARDLLARAQASSGFSQASLLSTESIPEGYSEAIVWAAIALADNDEVTGRKMLNAVAAQLDELEKYGTNCYGLEYLRAEVAALEHRDEQALQFLKRAIDKGWRVSWHARKTNYFANLRQSPRFISLLADVDARNAAMASRASRTN